MAPRLTCSGQVQEYLTAIDPDKAIDMDKQPWKAARPRCAACRAGCSRSRADCRCAA